MLLSRADAAVGADAPSLPVEQPAVRRDGLRLAGGPAEPTVVPEQLLSALAAEEVERFRPLLPVGYDAGADAYRAAVGGLTAADLSGHYSTGLAWLHDTFVPHLKRTLTQLSGGVWHLEDFVAYAAGSDVDFMTHVVEAVAAREGVCLYPGDWYGFQAGCTRLDGIHWDRHSRGRLACLCVPSVRNGQLSEEMTDFLAEADACLLNLNLFPTLTARERQVLAGRLVPVLERSLLSISFSRGFGLTASQLGVVLVPRSHPYRERFAGCWDWLTYFHNALAARAFMALDLARLEVVDRARRQWVLDWLRRAGLPVVESGSYYVKSFRLEGAVPERLRPLERGGLVRLCFKPPQT